jgi:predicted transposase YbfD/YdcC
VYQNLIKMKEIAHECAQSNSFYLALQDNAALDLRDNRGKLHNMSLVLCGLIFALLRGKDGNLSSIHRSMIKKQKELCSFLGIDYQIVISRSHLPVFLKYVNVEFLGKLVFQYFGVHLEVQAKVWIAIDGKELRGSILVGSTRGEAIVQAVTHSNRQVYAQGYYNGSKESERPVVESFLLDTVLASQNLTMDALHFTPTILDLIADAKGVFVVGLKGNQSEILTDMAQLPQLLKPDFEYYTKFKGHGRQETQHYKAYDISGEYFDKRWKKAEFKTMIQVKRTRFEKKKGKYSEEISYYMSNQKVSTLAQAKVLFKAIREHWAVETNNHIRDVTLKEDKLKTILKAVSLTTSIIRTLIINMLDIIKPKNMVAQLESFADDFKELEDFVLMTKFL